MKSKTHKKITFVTNNEDVRRLAGNQLSLLIQRFNDRFTTEAQAINKSLLDEDAGDILENLSQMSDLFTNALTELEYCSALMMQIESVEKDTDTEEDKEDQKKS